MMRYKSTALSVMILIACTTCGAEAKKPRMTPELLAVCNAMVQATQEADDELISQMEATVDDFISICRNRRRVPEYTEEIDNCSRKLNSDLPDNPYVPKEPPPEETLPSIGGFVFGQGNRQLPLFAPAATPTVQRVRLEVDSTLSQSMLEDFAYEPPKNWEGSPGSIVIITNGRDLVGCWGSGSSRKPIADSSGKVRLVIRKLTSD